MFTISINNSWLQPYLVHKWLNIIKYLVFNLIPILPMEYQRLSSQPPVLCAPESRNICILSYFTIRSRYIFYNCKVHFLWVCFICLTPSHYNRQVAQDGVVVSYLETAIHWTAFHLCIKYRTSRCKLLCPRVNVKYIKQY